MATTVKDKQAGKHDAYIDQQLARAEHRVRQLDVTAGLLALAAGTLLFAAAMMLLDRAFALSSFTRLVALLAYLAAAGTFAAYAIVRPLRWKVNPRFAARLIEDTLDSDRNHVVNWVDLREQKLPAVIRNSLGQRTAKDLGETDAERAVSPTKTYAAAAAFVAALLVCVLLFFVFGMKQFRALAARAVVPFGEGPVPTRTQVSIVRPDGGDAVVTIGQPITIVARVGGHVPSARARDAPCLLYRHDQDEPYRQRYLQADEGGSDWSATVAPGGDGQGFWYLVTAGDARTPEYQVTTRAAPLIRYFQVVYRHREYVGKADRVDSMRKLEGLEGTMASLTIWTNREVASGQLLFEGPGTVDAVRPQPSAVKGVRVVDHPQMLRFHVPLWKTCKYRIEYVSKEGEKYASAETYDLVVTPDHLPTAAIAAPAKDVALPADGHLEIAGEARDDIGVARVELYLTLEGKALAAKPYLADKLGKAGLGTPRAVAYREVLELPQLKDADGNKVELKAGMVVEYRLLAADACDFRVPPQFALSEPAYKIIIVEPKKEDVGKQQKDRDEARKRQEEHAKAEEERLKQEKDKQDARLEKERKDAADEEKKNVEEKNGKGEPKKQPQPKPDNKEKAAELEKDDRTQKQADEIRKELGDGKGDGKEGDKDDKGGQGDGKGGQDGKEESKAGAGKDDKAGEGKGGEDDKGGGKASEGKPPPNKNAKAGEGKGGGVSDGKEKGERKPEDSRTPDAPRDGKGKESKTEGRPAGEARPGQPTPKDGKPSESRGPGDKASESKQGGKDTGDQPGRSKSPDGKSKTDEAKAGQGKAGNDKRPDPREATPADVEKAAGDLTHAEPRQRQRAANDLSEMKNKAKDEQTRQAAQKAIEDGKMKGDLDGNGDARGVPEDAKKNPDKEDGHGEGKQGERGEDRDGQAEGKAGNVKGKQDAPQGNAGEGSDKSRLNSGGGDGAGLDKKNHTPEKARASQLQLELFEQKVDKNVLQKLKMSREQYERFLRDYEEMVKRQAKQRPEPERLPDPSRKGNLPGTGGDQLPVTGGGKDDVRNTGRPKPPPGYRDAYNEMLRRLGEQK